MVIDIKVSHDVLEVPRLVDAYEEEEESKASRIPGHSSHVLIHLTGFYKQKSTTIQQDINYTVPSYLES